MNYTPVLPLGEACWWLSRLPQHDGIHLLSEGRPFAHPEGEYDAQYENSEVEPAIAEFLLNAIGYTPTRLLEIACGTGHLTASLAASGRVGHIVASDASAAFLEITRRKVARYDASIDLLLLSDADFERIPAGEFDTIVLRSALHHFADFEGSAATLLSKLPRGGALLMLEPRADFHICSSLILRGVRDRVEDERAKQQTQSFIDTAAFYLDRTSHKGNAEDKYAFHFEELAKIALDNNATLSVLGGEYTHTFSSTFHDFLKYCHRFDADVLERVMRLAAEDLKFMCDAYASRPRYGAAEWFQFTKI